MVGLLLSFIEWCDERLESIEGWFADRLDDDCGVKRMFAFTVLLIVMLIVSTFTLSLPKDITGETLYRGDIVYGISGDTAELKKGTKLDIYGYRKGTDYSIPLFWAQTEDGQRGFVPQVNVVSEFIALEDMEDLSVAKFDKVQIKPIPNSDPQELASYMLTTAQGEQHEIEDDDLQKFVSPLVDEKLSNYERGSMSTYMSLSRFERRFIGEEIDYRYADYVRHYGSDSTVVRYGIKLINKKGDDKGVSRPTVTYVDGEAQHYTLGKKESISGNAKFLVYMPLSGVILDYGGWIINNRYNFDISMRPTTLAENDGSPSIWLIILAIFLIFFALAWLGMTNHILPGIIFSMLPFKTPLNALSNRSVYWLINATMWLSSYVWLVLMLAYGAIWWFVLPIMLITSRRMLKRLYSQLIVAPAMRCETCKRVDTKYRTSHDFIRRYEETIHRTILTRKRSVTGHSDSSKDYVTRYYTKYRETYDVDVYHDTYVCDECKQSEKVLVENRTLTSRVIVGTSQETSRS